MSTLTRFVAPLGHLRITQGFGQRLLDYTRFGLRGHNGIDFGCPVGTEVYAVMDGEVFTKSDPQGYGNVLWIRNKDLGLEVVYGHLSEFKVKDRTRVSAGQVVALSGNTGWSTGPHLHLGVKRVYWFSSGAGPFVRDEDNGYGGSIDPMPYFTEGIFDLPVDRGYGLPPAKSEFEWYKDAAWFWSQLKRLPTVREKKALLHGRWDFRTVNDPAMFDTWSRYSKMEYRKRVAG